MSMNPDHQQAIDDFKSAIHHLYYGAADQLDWQVREEKEMPSLEKVAELIGEVKSAIAEVEAKFNLVKQRDSCTDCDGTGHTSDGGNVFPCWCEIGCKIADEMGAIADVKESLERVDEAFGIVSAVNNKP